MSSSPRHPCPWCFSRKDNLKIHGTERLIEDCIKYQRQWVDAGSSRLNAKKFFNSIHSPIVEIPSNKSILDVIPPPELHLLIGVVNTIINKMTEIWKEEMEEWVRHCNVQREFVHGGWTEFEGNSCKTLIKNVDYLRAIANRNEQNADCLLFVGALQSFNKVVDDCFGVQLKETFETSIDKFKKNYLNLNITVTPKMHVVFHHVKDFCKKHGTGLGFFSEQAVESVHSDFEKYWTEYKVFKEHDNYAGKLWKNVVSYNSHHIQIVF